MSEAVAKPVQPERAAGHKTIDSEALAYQDRIVRKVPSCLIAFTVPASIMLAQDSFAATYKYVDKNGTASFCDNIYSILETSRKEAVIVEGGTGRAD